MARKRRAPSPAPAPPPPPPPPQESSESGSETEEEEEELPSAAATQNPPQNPQSHALAAAADSAESSEEESDSEADAQAFQMRPVPRSPTKPAAPVPPPGPETDEDEESESSDSETEVPEPVPLPAPKKGAAAAAAKKSKAVEQEDKKRPAPEPAPSGKGKKAKTETAKAAPGAEIAKAAPGAETAKAAPVAETAKAAPEAALAGKGKKAKAVAEKAAPEATPSGKAKQPGGKLEKSGLDSPQPSSKSEKSEKSGRPHRIWSKEDLIKILETLAAHLRSEGTLLKTDHLLAAVRDRLDRKDCGYADLYERVRRLKERYEKTASKGVVPSGGDDLQIYNLSDAVWGKKAKEAIAAAAASQMDSIGTKSKKGQPNKEKIDGNSKGGTSKEVAYQNGDTDKGSKKGQSVDGKTEGSVKSKTSKEGTTTGTPSKTKKQRNDKYELGKNAKTGTSKEATTTATQNGDALTKRKGGKMDVDPTPKEVSTGRQNDGTRTEEENHQEETEIGAAVQGTHRTFDELQNLYPTLASHVDKMKDQHPCGETLKRAFEFIGDEKANALEAKIKKQRLSEIKIQIRRADITKEVLNLLMGLVE